MKAKLYPAEVYDDTSIKASSNNDSYYQDEEASISYVSHSSNDFDEDIVLSDHNHTEEIDVREVRIYGDDSDDEDVEGEREEDYNDNIDFDELEHDTRETEDTESNFDSSSDEEMDVDD